MANKMFNWKPKAKGVNFAANFWENQMPLRYRKLRHQMCCEQGDDQQGFVLWTHTHVRRKDCIQRLTIVCVFPGLILEGQVRSAHAGPSLLRLSSFEEMDIFLIR